jgi:NADPH:quinone reductase-like Zn-dependent oxidoreductase
MLRQGVELTLILSIEAAGVVEAVGLEVSEFAVGERVEYAS